jgi:hypothetical protein
MSSSSIVPPNMDTHRTEKTRSSQVSMLQEKPLAFQSTEPTVSVQTLFSISLSLDELARIISRRP